MGKTVPRGLTRHCRTSLPVLTATSLVISLDGAAGTASPETSTSVKGDDKKETSSGGTTDEAIPSDETEATTSTAPSVTVNPTPARVKLHPRKRKKKQSQEQASTSTEPQEMPAISNMHLNEQITTNCYQQYLNLRRQISDRRRNLFPVKPKPPEGFENYMMNQRTYTLRGTAPTSPTIIYPPDLPACMKDLFTEQEKERYRLRMRHTIEEEKLVLAVEQEILREHGRAARELTNQSMPLSVCTILRDEDVYNFISPEQEEENRNVQSRFDGDLFMTCMEELDDKWEKIKIDMQLRHYQEKVSLHFVQTMDWEWKMKECNLCDEKTTPKIEEAHVPMMHTPDELDLLLAECEVIQMVIGDVKNV